MNNYNNSKSSRKVRFNLPDIAPQFEGSNVNTSIRNQYRKPIKEHGTFSYVNGTLMNTTTSKMISAQRKIPDVVTVTRIINPVPPLSIPTKIHIKSPVVVSCLKQQRSNESTNNDLTKYSTTSTGGIDYRTTKMPIVRIYDTKTAYSILPERKKCTSENIEELKKKHIVVINDNTTTTQQQSKIKPVKMYDCQTICDKFYRFRLLDDILMRKRKIFQKQVPVKDFQHDLTSPSPSSSLSSSASLSTNMNHSQLLSESTLSRTPNITKNLISHQEHTGIVADLIYRWKRLRHREEINKLNNGYKSIIKSTATVTKDPLLDERITFRKRSKIDLKRSVVS